MKMNYLKTNVLKLWERYEIYDTRIYLTNIYYIRQHSVLLRTRVLKSLTRTRI